jgi:molecular chaperone DnaK
MDKPNTPGGTDSSKSPWADDSGSEGGFGATGVFGTVQIPEEPQGQAVKPGPTLPWETAAPAPAAAAPPPVIPAKPLVEPVVHKVVFGSGEESSTQLLDRIRMVSAERAPAAPASQGVGGFTELLRTLSSDPAAAAPVAAAPVAPVVVAPAPMAEKRSPSPAVSGFTSLLQTLNASETAAPAKPAQPGPAYTPAAYAPAALTPLNPPSTLPAPSPGGFTELLQMSAPASPEPSFAPAQPLPAWGAPLGGQVPGSTSGPAFGSASFSTPAPAESKPGTFTQLFGTFSAEEPSAPPPADPPQSSASSGGPGSFTRMLSLEPTSPRVEPAYREEPLPLPGRVDYARTPDAGGPKAAPAGDPFAQTLQESLPVAPSAPAAGGVGITRLIQMLDEPSREPAPVAPPPPRAPAGSGPGPGLWTQTFEALSKSPEAAPPVAPSWTPPPSSAPPPVYSAPSPSTMPVSGFTPSALPAPAPAAGPSEFTRILDASRLREMAMRGGGSAQGAAESAAAGAVPPPSAPGMQMPAYPAITPPTPPAMPQGGGFAAPPRPQAPAFSTMPTPHAPAMSMPAAPAVPTPQPPAVKPPAAGKLQSFVPLMLVMIIVLLVVLLVTVIFLMKH